MTAAQPLMYEFSGAVTVRLATPEEPSQLLNNIYDILGVRMLTVVSNDGSKFSVPALHLTEAVQAIKDSLNGGTALADQKRTILCPNMHVPHWQPWVNADMAEVYDALGITVFNIVCNEKIYTVPAQFTGTTHAALTPRTATAVRQDQIESPMAIFPIAPAIKFQKYYRKEPSPAMCALASLVGARFVRILDQNSAIYWVHADHCEVVIRELNLLTI